MNSYLSLLPKKAIKEFHLATHEAAFRQGDRARGMFVVTSGAIQLHRHTEAGDAVTIHSACTGQSFAEASIFSTAYHCDAVASEPTKIIRYSKNAIIQTLTRNPDFAMALAKAYATQVQSYRQKLELFSVKSAEQRVYAAMAAGLLTTDIRTFSTEIGLAHEVVYRALSKLVAKHKIRKTNRGKYECKNL